MKELFKKNNIPYLAAAFILLIGCIVGLVLYFGGDKEKPKIKYDDVKVNGVIFEDIEINHSSGLSEITAKVKNTTKENANLTNLKIYVYDENDTLMVELRGYLGEVKAGQERKLSVNVDQDITKAKKVKISVE